MALVFLKYPFIKHYAGSIFDLDEAKYTSDGYNEEKISPTRYYYLPDAGHGYSTSLPFSDIETCPDKIVGSLNTKTGPCRITSCSSSHEGELIKCLSLDYTSIKESGGIQKQVLVIRLPQASPQPNSVLIFDRRSGINVRKLRSGGRELVIDCSELHAGFYEARIICENAFEHRVTFIKCFPVVLSQDEFGQNFAFSKTIW